jgi:hypothetical protein
MYQDFLDKEFESKYKSLLRLPAAVGTWYLVLFSAFCTRRSAFDINRETRAERQEIRLNLAELSSLLIA